MSSSDPEPDTNPRAARPDKAALWKAVAQRKREKEAREAQLQAEVPAPAGPENQGQSAGSSWNELYASQWEELQTLQAPAALKHAPHSLPQEPIGAGLPSSKQVPVPPPADQPDSLHQPDSRSSAPSRAPDSASPASTPPLQTTSEPAPQVWTASDSGSPRLIQARTIAVLAEETSGWAKRIEAKLPAWLLPIWKNWGGEAFTLSLSIHLAILACGAFLVVNSEWMDREVDFLPGSSAAGQRASENLTQKINQKRSPWLRKAVPMQRITSLSETASLQLPESPLGMPDLPESGLLGSRAKLGAGSGPGGGGFGSGLGLGSRSGMVFQPLSMFGREIKAKRLGVVLDISDSMEPFLGKVLDEVDQFAKGSVVVLIAGCGLTNPPKGGIQGGQILRTSSSDFERYWRAGKMETYDVVRRFTFKRGDPISSEDLFRRLASRPQTYFIHYVGVTYAWLALLSDTVRQADALYWFSDFQDPVDFSQLDVVRENLLRRRQRLYIHPYRPGSSFDLIKNQLVLPTRGEVIESPFE